MQDIRVGKLVPYTRDDFSTIRCLIPNRAFTLSVGERLSRDVKESEVAYIPDTNRSGYRAFGQDCDESSGHQEFNWYVIVHGPLIGLSFTW